MKNIDREKILNYSGKTRNLDGKVPYLREGFVKVEENIPPGDAPKLFIRVYKYGKALKKNPGKWPAYIAKVGHKWYPIESITEQLMTELGKLYKLNVADSKLVLASGQLRFLSKYFLKKDERLMHGAQIYASFLQDDISFVEEVEAEDLSRDLFTISFTLQALEHSFPQKYESIFCEFLKMLTFDAITGNNDRHFYNWGVILDVKGKKEPKFSPIYDTARGLFWNFSEQKIKNISSNQKMIDIQIRKYSKKSTPKTGLEQKTSLNHFQLIEGTIKKFSNYNKCITEVVNNASKVDERELLDDDFGLLMSSKRRKLIKDCLHCRKSKLKNIINK